MGGVSSQDWIYDQRNFAKVSKHKIRKIISYLPKRQQLKFLDVGCGDGRFHCITKHLNYKYHGIDISGVQLNKARDNGLYVKKHDLTKKWPYKNESFDVLLASEIIEHILDTDFFLQECHRVLKKKGTLILTTPNIAYLGGRLRCLMGRRPPVIECRVNKHSSGHIRAFSYYDLKSLFKDNKFKVVKYTGSNFYLPFISEKTKHIGKCCYHLSSLFPKLSSGFIFKAKKSNMINQ